MLKVYGSMMCPDCLQAKKNLDANNVEYEYIDINMALQNLKDFLALRDSSSVFDPARENRGIGIPALVKDDGSVTLDWEGYLRELGIEPVIEEAKAACSLDGKGC